MAENYYQVLGVAPDATPEQIRSAYRREAKRLHPDHTGGGCEPFRVIQEAYEVLGDPARRKTHDEQLAREELAAGTSRGVKPEPLQRRSRSVEPLVPRQYHGGPGEWHLGLALESLLEEFLRGPWESPRSAVQPAERSAKRIHLDVLLSPDEAWNGGRIRAWIPVQTWCPTCWGWGNRAFLACPRCRGTGTVDGNFPVEIAYPAHMPDGSTWTVPLSQSGMGNTVLVLHFWVAER